MPSHLLPRTQIVKKRNMFILKKTKKLITISTVQSSPSHTLTLTFTPSPSSRGNLDKPLHQ